MADILVADDTRSIRTALTILLEEEGHTVRLASDGDAALAEYREKRPDLLLLDIMMPKKNGYQVLKQIRRDDPALPVIILSAKDSPTDVALGLDLGSDDYLPKPFNDEVLVSRINAIFRRMDAMSPNSAAWPVKSGFRFASFYVDEGKHVLVSDRGDEEALSVREIGILRLLASRPNEVVTRDQMLNEIWGYEYTGTTRTLDQHIAQIRKKLGSDEYRITSVRGAGYRYSAG
jgi:DNA-binding response OmpR family regulator